MKANARARHETLNGRLKNFGALSQKFRHGIENHGAVFRAAAIIVQIQIEEESPLFSVDYDDLRYPPY
jgi:hypothetical protein